MCRPASINSVDKQKMLDFAGRRPFALAFNIKSGETAFNTVESGVKSGFIDENETTFLRPYFPRPRIFLAGTGPNLHYLATLAPMAKMDVRIVTSDEGTAGALARDGFETAPVEHRAVIWYFSIGKFTM